MARSKQKAIVDKYFVKTHRKNGMSSNFFECMFCKKSYAFNAFRLTRHLLACTKTSAEFAPVRKLIESSFMSSKRRSVSSSIPVDRREKPRNNDKLSNEIKLADETQNSTINIIDDLKLTGSCTADNSSSKLTTTNFHSNQSNTSIVSTASKSNYTSKHLSISSSAVFNDHRISISPEEEEIWTSLARAFYASEIQLNITENVYWIEVFKKIKPNLQLPTQYHLSNSLLDAEYRRIENKITEKIFNAPFLSLQLGGWYNIVQKPIMNIILMTPEPVVYKLVDTSNNSNTEECMTNIIENVFNALSHKTIISVVTDDAPDVTCSWRILKEKFQGDNISYYGCATHILNLAIKDIMELEIFSLLGNSAIKLCEEFEESHVLSSLLKQFQNDDTGTNEKKLTLILPNVELMNWVSYVRCFRSLILNKHYLKQVANSSEAIHCLSRNSLLKILDNHHTFLPKIEELMKILEPISTWIKTLKLKNSNLSDVICAFHEIKVAVNELFLVSTELKAEQQNVLLILENRKKMATEHIHLAAHMLDPRYLGKYLTKEEKIDATKFILFLAQQLKINENYVKSDLANYRTQSGLWSSDFVWDCLNVKSEGTRMEPLQWWNEICSTSNLATIASAIMQCPPSSVSQGKFSSYGLTEVKKKYQLNDDKASKLIYVRHNLKLQESKDFYIFDTDNDNDLSTIKQESKTEPDYDDSIQ